MRLLPALAATLLLAAAPAPAHAAEYGGGCAFDSVAPHGSDTFTGIIYAAVTSPRPVVTTVTCYVIVDGVEHPHTRLTAGGIGLTVGARVIEFTARDDQSVDLCEIVEHADEPGVVHGGCGPFADPPQMPPQWLIDLLNLVFDTANPVIATADATYCPVLATYAGTYGGVLTIREHGDVYVGDTWVWDCPPYWES